MLFWGAQAAQRVIFGSLPKMNGDFSLVAARCRALGLLRQAACNCRLAACAPRKLVPQILEARGHTEVAAAYELNHSL